MRPLLVLAVALTLLDGCAADTGAGGACGALSEFGPICPAEPLDPEHHDAWQEACSTTYCWQCDDTNAASPRWKRFQLDCVREVAGDDVAGADLDVRDGCGPVPSGSVECPDLNCLDSDPACQEACTETYCWTCEPQPSGAWEWVETAFDCFHLQDAWETMDRDVLGD